MTVMRNFAAGLILLAGAAVSSAAVWPQWRGPEGQGHAAADDLPVRWSESDNVAWKTAIPGQGHSSPVISADGRIWLTTAHVQMADPEERERRLKKNTGSVPVKVASFARFHVVVVDGKTGRILHDVEVHREKDPQWVHTMNSFASPTPVIDGDRLYAHFGASGTVCLDTKTLKKVWVNTTEKVMHENGPGSSPVLFGDHLIFHCDGSDRQYVVALDKRTGKRVWATSRSGEMNSNPQLKKAYCTPLVVKVGGVPQLVSPGADWLYGYDPASGHELWKVRYGLLGFSNVARPVAGHGMVFFSTGFMRSEMLAVSVPASGSPKIAWRFRKNVPRIPSPLLVSDELYFVSDRGGVLTCLDAKTGAERYRRRLGADYAASPMHAGGRIYLFDRRGVGTVIQAGPTYRLLAKNRLDGEFLASPAVDGNALILRTTTHLYRIGR